MRDPERAGRVVLAWRGAIPLFDPAGIAARVKRRAETFHWDEIERAADRVVAEELVGWAEEAIKLTRLMAEGAHEPAAVQRNQIADSMAGLVAIRKRLLHDERSLGAVVGAIMGKRWQEVQRSALGIAGGPFEETCEAALELYRLTARSTLQQLTVPQRRLVSYVCRSVGHPL